MAPPRGGVKRGPRPRRREPHWGAGCPVPGTGCGVPGARCRVGARTQNAERGTPNARRAIGRSCRRQYDRAMPTDPIEQVRDFLEGPEFAATVRGVIETAVHEAVGAGSRLSEADVKRLASAAGGGNVAEQ